MNELRERRKQRTAESYDITLQQLDAVLPGIAAHGDKVSAFFSTFVKRAIQTGGKELRKWINFTWDIPDGVVALHSFTIECKVKDNPGTFLKVERVFKPEDIPQKDQWGDGVQSLVKLISGRIGKSDPWAAVTSLVIGDCIVELIRRLDTIVSFTVEPAGITIVLDDDSKNDLYLKLYLGGCFAHEAV